LKVLLVGEGSREHAIASAICRSPQGPKLYGAMRLRNPGIRELCLRSGGDLILGDSMDPGFISKAADRFSVDFVFIGPEEPLFRGAANAIEGMGIPCIGARREAAEIEMSKAFMRRLMWKHKIPGRLRFQAFRDLEDALAYIEEYAESVAIKPARQAGGKGVKVIADFQPI
jgi:phosphoribosylamine--glycine ligase